jgi:hypothetical protein
MMLFTLIALQTIMLGSLSDKRPWGFIGWSICNLILILIALSHYHQLQMIGTIIISSLGLHTLFGGWLKHQEINHTTT